LLDPVACNDCRGYASLPEEPSLPTPAWPSGFRTRIGAELFAIFLGSALFLVFKPKNNPFLVGTISVIGMLSLALLGRYDDQRIWRPHRQAWKERFHSCVSVLIGPTLLVLGIFAVLAVYLSWSLGPFGAQMTQRFGCWSFFPALPVYLISALLQQSFAQWYMAGRLRVAFPALTLRSLALINGLFLGLVHLPMGDPIIVLLTMSGGAVWTEAYLRTRSLIPVAISHVLLGATYFYWVRGEDKLVEVARMLGLG